jgi:16S rRNA (guanine(1405)-N(7))-methyltransferase
MSGAVADIVAQVSGTKKSAQILPELVERIAARELAAGGPEKDIVKRVKRQLHQSGGAYFVRQPDYRHWLDALRAAGPDERLRLVQSFVRAHRSMAERSGDLRSYYSALYQGIPAGARVLDLACGLNPLAQAWMPWKAQTYLASDIYQDMLDFLAAAGAMLGTPVRTFAHDLTGPAPAPAEQAEADVVLLLKTLPCLDQISPTASARLLAALQVPEIIVTYPLKSLGGRNKGMAQNYRQAFERVAQGSGRRIEELALPYELGFRLSG